MEGYRLSNFQLFTLYILAKQDLIFSRINVRNQHLKPKYNFIVRFLPSLVSLIFFVFILIGPRITNIPDIYRWGGGGEETKKSIQNTPKMLTKRIVSRLLDLHRIAKMLMISRVISSSRLVILRLARLARFISLTLTSMTFPRERLIRCHACEAVTIT